MIGGGLAGLACAYRLMQRGHEVVVLEATKRAGGRICTVRSPWRGGLYAEAGASHLVSDPALMGLLDELSVAVESRPPPQKLAQARILGGKRRVVRAGERAPPGQPLNAKEEALGRDALMTHYFAPATTYDPAAPFPARLLDLDDMSGAEYLRSQGASPEFMREIDAMLGVGDTGLEGMSGLWLVQSWAQILREMKFGPSRRIAGGTDRLPLELARRLGDRVLLGARVEAVTQDERSVSVAIEQNGVRGTRSADRLVFAIPPTILKELPVAPALSAAKRRALAEISLESVTRVWVESDRRFWIERGESGRVETDLPIGPVRDEGEGSPGAAGLLGVYATRAEARRLAALGEQERILSVLESIELAQPGMRDHFVVGASKSWDNEPFQRGAYAYFKPGQLRAFGPHLQSPEGRCHFCGDHTSQRPGFMHGALASAWRVVDEISHLA